MAIRDVIQKVIEGEHEAKRMVEAARAEADRILSDARKEAQEVSLPSREETRVEAAKIMERAVQSAREEKEKRLAADAIEIETQVRLEESVMQAAVDATVRHVRGLG